MFSTFIMTCLFGDCNVLKTATLVGVGAASGVYLLAGATGTLERDWKYTALAASLGSALSSRWLKHGIC
jgi:hypothetical protein